MNRYFKVLGIFAIVVIAAVLIGAGVARALRDAAAPPALPYGLVMQDTRASVEQKLGQPRVTYAPQAGWEPGLPEEGGSPDHLHYWAIYRRFGLVVIYNSPSPADRGATIHSILPANDPAYFMKQAGSEGS